MFVQPEPAKSTAQIYAPIIMIAPIAPLVMNGNCEVSKYNSETWLSTFLVMILICLIASGCTKMSIFVVMSLWFGKFY